MTQTWARCRQGALHLHSWQALLKPSGCQAVSFHSHTTLPSRDHAPYLRVP